MPAQQHDADPKGKREGIASRVDPAFKERSNEAAYKHGLESLCWAERNAAVFDNAGGEEHKQGKEEDGASHQAQLIS